MSLPVLIAAYNEEALIGRTLLALPRSTEPIVIANGCDDATADIARGLGATVIERETPAKMGALQAGIASLGHRATDGFAILDADSRPIFPKQWSDTMQRNLGATSCNYFCGTVMFDGERGRVGGVLRSALIYAKDIKGDVTHSTERLPGANMGLRPNEAALEAINDLPETLWPGEDRAMRDEILAAGGNYRMNADPRLVALSSARAYSSLLDRIIKGKSWVVSQSQAWHASKAPTGQIDYEEWRERQQVMPPQQPIEPVEAIEPHEAGV